VYAAASRAFTNASMLLGGRWVSPDEWAMLCVIAIRTAAGVPCPLTSATKMPHRPPGSGKKS
jgi:hypothetical protein